MTEDWGLRFAHLPLDRKLRLHENIGAHAAADGDEDGRDHENRRKRDDSKHLEEHEETELNEEICCLCNVVVD